MSTLCLRSRVLAGSILATVACCLLAAPAAATVTTTEITSPASPHYSIHDYDNPAALSVSGTASGATDGDLVDLRCYHDDDAISILVAEDVGVTGAAFTATPGALPISDRVCTLRAVPANTTPGAGALGPYVGAVLATGSRFTTEVFSGPNMGLANDFEIWAQQLVGAGYYQSAGACGLSDTSLTDDTLTRTTTTFQCADFFYRDEAPGGDPGTRSQLQVDGNNAYASATAADINAAGAGFRPISYSYVQDPVTGDITINESEEIVKCADATFPATVTSCATFLSTGLRLDRAIVQESDGRLITITDQWSSIDGQAHSLDMLNQNDQGFESPADVAYRFPGEAGFDTHSPPDQLGPFNTTPAAIYLQRNTAPTDPDPRGKGAIVFDRPASSATFNFGGGQFYLHQTATVPANSCATVRFAYVQAYNDAGVQSRANTALTNFASPPGPCPPAPPGMNPTTNPPASGPTGQRAAALKKCKKKKGKARKKCKKRASKLPV